MHAVHDEVARRETFVVVGALPRAARPAVHAAAAGEVGFGDDRELHAGQHDAAVERRDHHVHAGRAATPGSPSSIAVTRSTTTPSPTSSCSMRSAEPGALGRDEHAEPVGAQLR